MSTSSGYFASLTSKGVMVAETLIHKNRKFNVYIECDNGRFNLFNINLIQVEVIGEAYSLGKKEVTINHESYCFKVINSIAIVTNTKQYNKQELQDIANESEATISGGVLDRKGLEQYGDNVTVEFIPDKPYGYARKTEPSSHQEMAFINTQRIIDLNGLRSASFDLSKLVRMCEELNNSYQAGNYFTVGLLLRTIINHVPPLFGPFTSFNQVIADYGNESFKNSMRFLDKGLRSIADSYNHDIIRRKETLPTPQQISYASQLDTLLAEIIKQISIP